jgi:small subunit ribosomal protein S16
MSLKGHIPYNWVKRWNLVSMTVKIRLKRTGMKKAPSYRIVVADSRSPRDGRIIENIGWYNPRVEPSAININEEKALNWLKNGAQPTDSVNILLKRTGVLDRFQEAKQPVGAVKPAQ